jgi:hypothetical protein
MTQGAAASRKTVVVFAAVSTGLRMPLLATPWRADVRHFRLRPTWAVMRIPRILFKNQVSLPTLSCYHEGLLVDRLRGQHRRCKQFASFHRIIFIRRAMSGIFTLAIECVGGRHLNAPYKFVLAVLVESTLGDLASSILGMLDFDGDDHLDEFYLANNQRGKRTWLTPAGAWDEDGEHVKALRLADIFPLPKNKKLYYLYDLGACWRFQISKQGKQTEALADTPYPCVVSETGTVPQEYGDDEDED